MRHASSLFGRDADRFIGMVDQLGLPSRKTRYSFLDTGGLGKNGRERRGDWVGVVVPTEAVKSLIKNPVTIFGTGMLMATIQGTERQERN